MLPLSSQMHVKTLVNLGIKCVDFLMPLGVCINMCIAVRWFSHEDGLYMLIFNYTCPSKYTLK